MPGSIVARRLIRRVLLVPLRPYVARAARKLRENPFLPSAEGHLPAAGVFLVARGFATGTGRSHFPERRFWPVYEKPTLGSLVVRRGFALSRCRGRYSPRRST